MSIPDVFRTVKFRELFHCIGATLHVALDVTPKTPGRGIKSDDKGRCIYTVLHVDKETLHSTYLIYQKGFQYSGLTVHDFMDEFFKWPNITKHIKNAKLCSIPDACRTVKLSQSFDSPDATLKVELDITPNTPTTGIKPCGGGRCIYTVIRVDKATKHSTYPINKMGFTYGGFTMDDFMDEFFTEPSITKHIKNVQLCRKRNAIQ